MSNLAANPYTNTSPSIYTAPTHPGHGGGNQSSFGFGQSGSTLGVVSLLIQLISLLQQGNSNANSGYQAQPQGHQGYGHQNNQQAHQWPSQGGQQQPNLFMRNTFQQPQQWNNINPNQGSHVGHQQHAGAGQLGFNLGNAGTQGHAGAMGHAAAIAQGLGSNLGGQHLAHQAGSSLMSADLHQGIGAGTMPHHGGAVGGMGGAMPGTQDQSGRYIGPMQGLNQTTGMMGMAGHGGMVGHDMAGHNNFVGEDGEIQPGHDFYAHTHHLYPETLAQDQTRYGGYSWINDNILVGRNPITGMQPVIDQAIDDVMKKAANRKLSPADLEAKVANRLTQLNDWNALNKDTQAKLVELTGQDFGEMTKAEREKSINHLLHSPLPFGAVQEVLNPNQRIDLSYTHTLDEKKTMAEDLGNNQFNITLISNNNNGSHTGHNLGSFVLQMGEGATVEDAKEAANDMVLNTNNNNKLYLDEVARSQLFAYKTE